MNTNRLRDKANLPVYTVGDVAELTRASKREVRRRENARRNAERIERYGPRTADN